MERRPLKRLGAMAAAGAIALALIGCRGNTGPAGATGATGATGNPGTTGTTGTPGTNAASINAADLTAAQWSALTLKGTVQSVDLTKGTPVVTFSVTDINGNGIAGLTKPGPDGLSSHFAFSIAKLIPGATGSPSRWVNYMFVKAASADGKTPASLTAFPDPETEGTLIDNNDGTYTYTFALDITKAQSIAQSVTLAAGQNLADLDDLSYDTAKMYRLLVLVGGAPTNNAGALPVKTPANIVYDFMPSNPNAALPAGTDERMIVNEAACNGCHTKLTMHANYMVPIQTTRACVICHTDQMKFGAADSYTAGSATLAAVGPYGSTMQVNGHALPMFPNFIHKIHMGENLGMTGYSLFGTPFDTKYPQDLRNCTTCHTNQAASTAPNTVMAPQTADGDNWMMVPSRVACGACHDTVDFNTGANHGPNQLAQPDDSSCAGCHGKADIPVSHAAIYPYGSSANPTATGASQATWASNPDQAKLLGAHQITWSISKVVLDANMHPEMTFQILQDGTPLQLNAQPTAGSTSTQMIPNYSFPNSLPSYEKGPMVYFLAGVPQDGIAPADYNYTASATLQNIWAQVNSVTVSGTGATAVKIPAGTLSGPDASNNYTVVFTSVTLPANTTMLAGAMGYGSPIETDLGKPGADLPNADFTYASATNTGGLRLPVKTVMRAADSFTTTGTTSGTSMVRRSILKDNACLSCHQNLGFFTKEAFHTGNYNDGKVCITCHLTTHNDSNGFSINAKDWVHGIHGGGFRTYAYTAWPTTSTSFDVGYPGLLNNCEACHVPGSYNFSNADSQAQLGNLLWDTITSAYSASAISPTMASNPAPGGSYQAPWLTPANTGGKPFAANFTTGAPAYGVTAATGTSAVVSPITAACTGCHDSTTATAHMTQNGGVLYATRTASYKSGTTNLVSNEQCLVCHGAGAVMDIQTVHMNF